MLLLNRSFELNVDEDFVADNTDKESIVEIKHKDKEYNKEAALR